MKYVPNLVTVVAVIIGIVCFGQAHSTELTDPFKNMKNDSFFSESNSDSLDSDFDKKMDDMFSTIKRAQKSVENTKLGPMGRYVLGRNLAARVFGIYKPVELSDPRLAYLRTVAHGTGYPNNRQELMRKGAQGKNISAEAVEARKQRYRAAIQK